MVSELYLKKENPLNNWAYAMLSQMYIALPFALLNVLAFHSDETASLSQYNAILPLSIFIFNWVNDTGAYCTGMLFGKHKLFERISPKKSWEGSIGGGIFCIIASFLLSHFFPFMSTGVWIGLALTVVVFAPFLNSSIYIDSGNSSYFYRYYQGYLRKGKDEKTFIIENYSSSYELPEVQVIYEE